MAHTDAPCRPAGLPGLPIHFITMTDSTDVEQRLTALEIKASYADDLLDQLNQLVYRQQEQIARLARELIQLRQQAPEDDTGSSRDPRADIPPHY